VRKLLGILLVAWLVVGLAATAGAIKKDWSGVATIEIGTLPPLLFTASAVATINGSSGGAHLSTLRLNGGLNGTDIVPVTDPTVTAGAIVGISVQGLHNMSGTFAPISTTPTLTQNVMPIPGLVRICLVYVGCNSGSLNVDLTQNGTRGAGIGGLITIGGVAGGLAGIRVSGVAMPWTLQTVTLSRRTDNGGIFMSAFGGFAHGPASATSSTALTSGVVQLVTPIQVSTIGVPGNNDLLPLFGILTIHFVPEPAMLLLLGAGVAGLAILGRHRRRK
jgi:hypothetical protein